MTFDPASQPLISLIGMPGGGKSTVGRHLARALQCSFADADSEVEKRIGGSIRNFFEREGESRFRDVEEEAVRALMAGAGGRVVATGGGVVLREANRDALRSGSTVVYLRSTPEELFRRLRHDTQRPLLQVRDPMARLRELFRERDPLYRATAHFIIDTGRPSVPSLVRTIRAQLELAGVVRDPQPDLQPLAALTAAALAGAAGSAAGPLPDAAGPREDTAGP